jgi:hypothetical protein
MTFAQQCEVREPRTERMKNKTKRAQATLVGIRWNSFSSCHARGITWSATIGGRTPSWGRHASHEFRTRWRTRRTRIFHNMAAGNANGEPAHPRREKITSQQKTKEIPSRKQTFSSITLLRPSHFEVGVTLICGHLGINARTSRRVGREGHNSLDNRVT